MNVLRREVVGGRVMRLEYPQRAGGVGDHLPAESDDDPRGYTLEPRRTRVMVDDPRFEEPVCDAQRRVDWSAFLRPVKPTFVIASPPSPDRDIPRRGMTSAQGTD